MAAETDRKAHRSHEDLLAAVLRFAGGPIGVLEVNWLTPDKVRQLTVTAERGMFAVDYVNQHLTLLRERDGARGLGDARAVRGGERRQRRPVRDPKRRAAPGAARFVRPSDPRRGCPPEVSGEDGLRAVRLALAIVEAGSTGASVALDDGGPVTEASSGIGLAG